MGSTLLGVSVARSSPARWLPDAAANDQYQPHETESRKPLE